jgi:ligand-binding sensor domain-containing protein
VSPDLSRGIDRDRLKLMDRVWSIDAIAKNTSSSFFGAIVAVEESPLKEGQLWIGTDDGILHVSENGGGSWRKIESFPGVPDTTQVARVTPSSHDANTVYAAFDGHMSGD